MPAPVAATISVADTLSMLDGSHSSFASGFADGRYALWLGSGISLGRVPGLKGVVAKVAEFIRSRIDAADANCKYAQAMGAIFNVANATADERARSNLTTAFDTWPDRDAIVARLVGNYSRLLGINLPGEPFDYLVWNAVDVCSSYADAGLTPDVEHLCIAALSLEGSATDLVSANWDPLIERAILALTDGNAALAPTVVARPADIQLQRRRTRLIKFHGCAALAAADEGNYREWLVATNAQVVGWCSKPENAPLLTAMVALLAGKPTLMLGLSAQDANIQQVFSEAASQITWQVGAQPPGYVFSEDELGSDQQALLQNVYRNQVGAGNFQNVLEAARIQAFAKPLLTALLLDVLTKKLASLVETSPALLPAQERQPVIEGLVALRDKLAFSAEPTVEFIEGLFQRLARASQLLRAGRITTPNRKYVPISLEAVSAMQGNPDIHTSGIREAAFALGIIGAGLVRGDWTVEVGATDLSAGMVCATGASAGAQKNKIYVTANASSATCLRAYSHLIDTESPILIQAGALIPKMQRSPRTAAGRTGLPSAREVSLTQLLESAASFDALYDGFRREVVL